MQYFDVIIVGAGAAGMMCAIEAARRGRSVMVIDHNSAPGEKIRISGGGRCNLTNLHTNAAAFLSENPKFAISALTRYSQWSFIDFLSQAGIAWHEKTLGQLFCDGSAKQIVALLTGEMAKAAVDLRLGCIVEDIVKTSGGFTLRLGAGSVRAASVVIATGGKSIPKMGASGFGYRVAEKFGLRLVETRPGLVPLTFAPHDLAHIAPLAGLSVEARVSTGETGFQEGLLFTHRGLSGPSILQISSYWREGEGISVDLLPGQDALAFLRGKKAARGAQSLMQAYCDVLPKRLAALMAETFGSVKNLADYTEAELRQAAAIGGWVLKPVGSEGYRTAEVTLGGVATDSLDAKTMQSKTVPGLFFVGEVVDVTGWLGGYNFQWAWSSGWAAGQVV